MIEAARYVVQQTQAQLKIESDVHSEHLIAHRCKTIEDYNYHCGVIQGLALAGQLLNDLITKMEHDADG